MWAAAARCASIALVVSMALPPCPAAGEHLVAPAEITARLRGAGATRADNEHKVLAVLSARLGAAAPGLERKLRTTVAVLSDAELRDLASRAEVLEANPAAGGAGKVLLIVGVVVLVAIVLLALI